MSIDISQKPEMNVVNVGDEVTADQIAAIQNAAAPTAANPFATIADVGGGGGGSFDQSLNTTDTVIFQGISGGDLSYSFNIVPTWITVSDIGATVCDVVANYQVGEGGFYINDQTNATQVSLTNYGLKFSDGTIQTTAAGALSTIEGDGAGVADQFVNGGEYQYVTAVDSVYYQIGTFAVGQVGYIASHPNSGANVVTIGLVIGTLTGFNFPIGVNLELYAGQIAKIIRVNDDQFGSPVFHAHMLS